MKTIHNILLPTDFEDTFNVVLEEAIDLARKYNASLHVLHVNIFPVGVPFASTYFDPETNDVKMKIDAYVDEKYDEIKEKYGDQCQIVFANRASERVLHGINEYVEECDIDLILMSSHGRKAFTHFFLGSIAEEVIRLSKIPVMIVKNEKTNFVENMGRILVPIDFSENSKEAAKGAINVASAVNAEVHFVHVVPNMIQLHVEGAEINVIKNYPDLIKDTKAALKTFHEDIDADFTKVKYKVLFGVAAVELSDYADQHRINMILISSHGLTGIKKFFIGNVAEKIVRLATCPVFILK